jgi:mRNA-degrading endonuclease RelE of RelBE toxin-antitoxin system
MGRGFGVAFTVEIVPSALNELQEIEILYRRRIAQAIDQHLPHQPTTPTRNRKVLQAAEASFEFDPPLWELRVGDFRVFYDIDEPNQIVRIRAVRAKPPHASSEDIL